MRQQLLITLDFQNKNIKRFTEGDKKDLKALIQDFYLGEAKVRIQEVKK